MYDDILLPTDGSEATTAAVDHVGRLAEVHGATVHVLSVVDTRNRFESPSSGLAPDAWLASERERARQAVDEAVETLPGDVPAERVVEEGVPKSAILGYVEENGPDLVVMGTHGRTGLDHYLIGSVAENVVRESPVPVTTVRVDE
ncbi:universal stress protein [Halosimplex pelagicum]|uniref:Universal stress protein n=1 Tax=Halosimplex pelagicum TaxID=869886 RepID=A0A7D5T951_9EURY|nr:universal stress protein [Halosimplex pelagicum]QLH80233.1 universal stress protein [Halosimplex pelagicum]